MVQVASVPLPSAGRKLFLPKRRSCSGCPHAPHGGSVSDLTLARHSLSTWLLMSMVSFCTCN